MLLAALPCLALPALQLPFTDTLLVDLEATPSAAIGNSYPTLLASDGTTVWFTARTESTGEELWVSDGTPGGTHLVVDLFPGTAGGLIQDPIASLLPDGRLVFLAYTPETGREPFVSDGTAAGTFLLRDILPGETSSSGSEFRNSAAFGDHVYFFALDDVSGREVWRTDGTKEGTELAFDLQPGIGSIASSGVLLATPTHLFIAAEEMAGGSINTDLYAWSGGAATPALVHSYFGFLEHRPGGFAISDDRLVYQVARSKWWISDGTAAGTRLLVGSANWDTAGWCAATADAIYLCLRQAPSQPYQLLVSQGVPGDVLLVSSYEPLVRVGSIAGPFATGIEHAGGLVFAADVPGAGIEPVFTAGSPASTQLLGELEAGSASSEPYHFVRDGNEILFLATTAKTGREWWKVDAEGSGILPLPELVAGPGGFGESPLPSPPLPSAGGLLFGGNEFGSGANGFGQELYGVTNGGPVLLANISSDGGTQDADPMDLVRLGDRVIFHAYQEPVGRELFTTDGTAAGTVLVADLTPGVDWSLVTEMASLGSRVLVSLYTPALGYELWATDGTAEGTSLVLDIDPGTNSSNPYGFTRLGHRMFFVARDTVAGNELWVTDGTAAGTERVADIAPGPEASTPFELTVLGDEVLFRAETDLGRELWASDGTAAGTRLVADISPGPGDSQPSGLRVLDDRIFFTASTPDHGRELWITDGTTAGTQRLTDIQPGPTDSAFAVIGRVVGGMAFAASDAEHGRELWFSDGTPAGTQLVADLTPGPNDTFFADLYESLSDGQKAYFSANAPDGGQIKLWVTDGTAVGTRLLDSGQDGEAFSLTGQRWQAGGEGQLFFQASSIAGLELWTTRGTSESTLRLTDTIPGSEGGQPGLGVQLANRLIFPAQTNESGVELHSIPLVGAGAFGATPLGPDCIGGATVPSLKILGKADIGAQIALRITETVPNSTALHLWSPNYAQPDPSSACSLQLGNALVLATVTSDSMGDTLLPLQLPPATALVGLPLYFQAAVIELGGPFLGAATLTNAFELIAR